MVLIEINNWKKKKQIQNIITTSLFYSTSNCFVFSGLLRRRSTWKQEQIKRGLATVPCCHRLPPSQPAWTHKVKEKHFVHVSLSDFQTLTLSPRSNRFLPTGLEGLAGRRGERSPLDVWKRSPAADTALNGAEPRSEIYLQTPTMESLTEELSLFSSNSICSSPPKYMVDCNYNVAS